MSAKGGVMCVCVLVWWWLGPAAGVVHAAAAPWPAGLPAPASSLPGAGSSLLRTARPSACLLAPARGPLQTPAATAPPPPPPPDPARSTRRFWSVILPFTLASPVGIFVGLIISDVAQGVGAASISALASGACCAVLRPFNAAGRRRWGGGALSPLGCTCAMRCVLDRRTVHTARALLLSTLPVASAHAGTFLYVAFMEVIPRELRDPHHVPQKLAALVLGFSLMSILAVWA